MRFVIAVELVDFFSWTTGLLFTMILASASTLT